MSVWCRHVPQRRFAVEPVEAIFDICFHLRRHRVQRCLAIHNNDKNMFHREVDHDLIGMSGLIDEKIALGGHGMRCDRAVREGC